MLKKALFELVRLTKKGNPIHTSEFFENKMEAKAKRDELNGGKLPEHDEGYRVIHGPDHWRRQGML